MKTRSVVHGALVGALLAAAGCRTPTHGPATAPPQSPAGATQPARAPTGATVSTAGDAAAPALAPSAAPGEKVLLVENGQEKMIDAAQAVAQGYTLVDLSDDWTPFIFAEQ